MEMKFQMFKNITKQGFQGMWRNRGMGLASVTSISAVLMILGLILILILSINSLVVDTQSKFDEIEVFLLNDATEEDITALEEAINSENGVKKVEFKSRDEALKIMQEEWGEEAYLLEGLEEDVLPNSYVIKLKDIEYADDIVKAISGMNGVEKINYHKEIIDKLMTFANYVRLGGIAIIAALILVSIFIISNTIKLTVASRKREIGIMKYVGATNGYIKGPFIIEGILFGLIGALLSIGLVYYGYDYFFESVSEKVYAWISVILVPPELIINDIVIIFTAIGAGIGALGSLVSMKKYLNV